MAISMSGAEIDTSERDTLLANEVDSSVVQGGVTANTSYGLFGLFGGETTGATLAGVTADFASSVKSAIDTYKSEVQSYLDQIDSADSTVAFQGSEIGGAIKNFIDAVKDVATRYLTKLSEAEQLIIDSVQSAYQTQDSDLTGDMSSDASTLDSSNGL